VRCPLVNNMTAQIRGISQKWRLLLRTHRTCGQQREH
jgi:hypothetical protein